MRKFLATFKLTYFNKLKSKAFIISTILFMLAIIGLANADKIIKMFDDGQHNIAVVTKDERVFQYIKKTNESLHKGVHYKKLSASKVDQALKDESIDQAYMIHTEGDRISATIKASKQPSEIDQKELQTILTQFQSQKVAQKLGLTPNEQKELFTPSTVDTKVIKVGEGQSIDQNEKAFSSFIVMIGSLLMMFIIINYANQIAMEVATEKTSRVSEMIITSVKPSLHIIAKITAVLSVALTQIAAIGLTVIACVFFFDLGKTLKGLDFVFTPHITRLIIFGIIFLIIGVFTYVIFAAILGNLTARIEDMGQTLMPLTMLMIASFYTGYIGGLTNPDNIFIKITSYVPFFSPFVTFARLSIPETPTYEAIIAIVIHLVLILVLFYFATKSYQNAVLTFEKGWWKAFKRVIQK
ncbi:ABC transporter permease [Staphylococcus hyicus]|uniref:ABC transporter permease n=1 Tax=Staphylococcus hyicus TaxID=1284 RepID=A0ACD5FPX3_STAHY|nr:ABC transporter permease [Staphylococcus hyicus]MDP4449214.1 ABC transporter permease [Staphylococcus hyicus]MDP4462954.1 ABC transporter permease [Staphylococcus hyicus]